MPQISDLHKDCSHQGSQREYIKRKVKEVLEDSLDQDSKVRRCIRRLWSRYDSGGISIGRSLRAVLLEETYQLLESGLIDEAKELLAVMIAMYHSPEYINEHKWFDYEVSIDLLPVEERILLLAVASILGVVKVPDITTCTDDYVFSLTQKVGRKRKETHSQGA